MKITVDLSDEDIRKTIKELIRQQVVSIVRDEYREAIQAEVESKAAKCLQPTAWDVRNAYESVAYRHYNNEEMKEAARELIDKRLGYLNLESIVKDAVSEQLAKLTKLSKKVGK